MDSAGSGRQYGRMSREAKDPADEDVVRACQAIMEESCDPGGPGTAVIVARGGRAVFRAGFGLANLELGVPVDPAMVFRLGSITKQFTAVCLLMLAEHGKLDLGDDITKFLPDYPTHDREITIEHLLTHTSGIRSYTGLPDWPRLWRQDMTVQEILDLFKDEDPVFEPGERFDYCNSGYILLGAIIEAVSDLSYEQFLHRHIFEPLHMEHTFYDHADRLMPGRVSGYEKRDGEIGNAAYLSMTQPYAAGGLASSVDDLLTWDSSLDDGKLVTKESLTRAFTPYRLNDGSSTGYGYGWASSEYAGRRTIEHGGGINGFLTHALRVPDAGVFVAILMNSIAADPPPEYLSVRLAGEAIGLPYRKPEAISLSVPTLDAYAGTYRIGDGDERTVARDGNRLLLTWPWGTTAEIAPTSSTDFFIDGPSFDRLTFETNATGAAVALSFHGRDGQTHKAARVDQHPSSG